LAYFSWGKLGRLPKSPRISGNTYLDKLAKAMK